MPNDAKCGLIVGVVVVLAISAVFFRKEPGSLAPRSAEAAAAAVSASNVRSSPARNVNRAVTNQAPGGAAR
jgi:hypothetical protein